MGCAASTPATALPHSPGEDVKQQQQQQQQKPELSEQPTCSICGQRQEVPFRQLPRSKRQDAADAWVLRCDGVACHRKCAVQLRLRDAKRKKEQQLLGQVKGVIYPAPSSLVHRLRRLSSNREWNHTSSFSSPYRPPSLLKDLDVQEPQQVIGSLQQQGISADELRLQLSAQGLSDHLGPGMEISEVEEEELGPGHSLHAGGSPLFSNNLLAGSSPPGSSRFLAASSLHVGSSLAGGGSGGEAFGAILSGGSPRGTSYQPSLGAVQEGDTLLSDELCKPITSPGWSAELHQGACSSSDGRSIISSSRTSVNSAGSSVASGASTPLSVLPGASSGYGLKAGGPAGATRPHVVLHRPTPIRGEALFEAKRQRKKRLAERPLAFDAEAMQADPNGTAGKAWRKGQEGGPPVDPFAFPMF